MGARMDTMPLFERADRVVPHRTLSIIGNLSNDGAKAKIAELRTLQKTDGDILVTINSPGGHTAAGFSLYREFSSSTARIIGYVDGKALSAAFMALQGCHLRLATRDSKLWIHNPEWQATQVVIKHDTSEKEWVDAVKHRFTINQYTIRTQREEMIEKLLSRSNFQTRNELEKFLENENPISADEALSLGFLDGVV